LYEKCIEKVTRLSGEGKADGQISPFDKDFSVGAALFITAQGTIIVIAHFRAPW